MVKNFKQTILDCFNDVIIEFEFSVKANSRKAFNILELENEKCIIRFIEDMEYTSCDFIDPIERMRRQKIVRKDGFPSGYPVYPVYSVWQFLYPNHKADFNYRGMDLEGQVLANKRLILERFRNVLNGDFSWTAAYQERETQLSRKVEYMMTHWERDNPVRIKFDNGDPGWEKAFDDYKRYLDNLQR